jgi:hypothetical protein
MQRKGFNGLDEVRGLLAGAVLKQGTDLYDGGDRTGYLNALRRATTKYSPDT